jgi:serine/threonine-protein kinase haspin
MPRKQVYGKRGNANSAFQLSKVFCSASSPLKIDATTKNDVEATTVMLESLKIEEKTQETRTERPRVRRALSVKDGNVKPAKVLAGKKKEKSKDVVCVLEENIPESIELPIDVVATLSPSKPLPIKIRSQPECTSRQEVDPYIHPLLALSTNPTATQPFTAWSQTLEPFFTISKIAEASYGEVYRLALSSPHPTFTSTDESVLKILALKPPAQLQDEDRIKSKSQIQREKNMSSVSSVVSEVQLLKRMTEVPGFTNFRALHILRGRPAPAFIAAWKAWNKSKPAGQKSSFPDPSRKANYTDEQLWAVIEMQDAGTDVEKLHEAKDEVVETTGGAWDVFWQVVIAVGKGEEIAGFEHRDLHLGNICVNQGGNRKKGKVGRTGLETTIIDYTLSRAEMAPRQSTISSFSDSTASTPSLTYSIEEQDQEEVAFLDLAIDPALFESDATEEYQYEVYRYMRNAMYFSNALKPYSLHEAEAADTGRSWRGFHPQTNLIWLHFVLRMLIGGIVAPPSEDDGAEGESEWWRWTTLKKVEELLRIETIPREGLGSVRDLIAIALEERWLDEGDVVGEALPDFVKVLEVENAQAKSKRRAQRVT